MERKRRKAQPPQERRFFAVILCRDPTAETLIRQLLSSNAFVIKESPSFEADLFIVEEGLLTPTERKMLRALAEFGTIKAVAEYLRYHPVTVKRHLCRIYKKLKVKTAPQVTALAVRLGLI